KSGWKDALDELASTVEPARLVVVTDGPRVFGVSPAECASGHPQNVGVCDVEESDFNRSLENTETRWAEERPGAASLSLREIICSPSGSCPIVRGNVFVLRDNHHLTTEFASLLAPELMKRIHT